ncbi:Mob1/phocein [Coprinopsis marcescibilis]|uniref:Mob1/phocein n=1 Tax=Coprinopsis marcescibilis TaxID=230819 RepID=A0A5C3KRZ5_COPMA|nr:Mob1/phocein [Coprinopsis marcescibilis]
MTATIQRPVKGSKVSTFWPVKSLSSLASLESAFQLQEYISLLIRLDVHDVEAITSLPGSNSNKDAGKSGEEKDQATEKKGEVQVDQWCWVYEHLRRLAQDLTHPLITTLQQECTRATCPEMKAGEWLYLCVAHGNEGSMEQCCAVDYILHTLDSATALLNSPRAFPSRISILETSQRHFSSLARRLGRIFAHAYFHHREAFEQAEAESSLYGRFLALTSKFDLVPSEFLPIPPEAFYANGEDQNDGHGRDPPKLRGAGLEPQGVQGQHKQEQQQPTLILRPEDKAAHTPHHLEAPSPGTSSPPGLVPEGSPRPGRGRTDTMVLSGAEAAQFAEQLAARSAATPEDLALDSDEPSQEEDVASTQTEPVPAPEIVEIPEPVEQEEELVEDEEEPVEDEEEPVDHEEEPVEQEEEPVAPKEEPAAEEPQPPSPPAEESLIEDIATSVAASKDEVEGPKSDDVAPLAAFAESTLELPAEPSKGEDPDTDVVADVVEEETVPEPEAKPEVTAAPESTPSDSPAESEVIPSGETATTAAETDAKADTIAETVPNAEDATGDSSPEPAKTEEKETVASELAPIKVEEKADDIPATETKPEEEGEGEAKNEAKNDTLHDSVATKEG